MTYDYKCQQCGHVQEAFGISVDKRDDPVTCEECGGECRRMLSPVTHSIKQYKRLYGKRVDDGKVRGPNSGLREI